MRAKILRLDEDKVYVCIRNDKFLIIKRSMASINSCDRCVFYKMDIDCPGNPHISGLPLCRFENKKDVFTVYEDITLYFSRLVIWRVRNGLEKTSAS